MYAAVCLVAECRTHPLHTAQCIVCARPAASARSASIHASDTYMCASLAVAFCLQKDFRTRAKRIPRNVCHYCYYYYHHYPHETALYLQYIQYTVQYYDTVYI